MAMLAQTRTGNRRSKPSAWLLEHLELLSPPAPGRALDVACGAGRNALLLDELGFQVDAVDVDQSALQELERKTIARGGRIHAVHADVTTVELAGAAYQVVVNFNFLERSIFSRLSDALAPDGLLIFETFTRDHVEILGNRMNPAYLLEPNELLHAFRGLRVLHYRETVVNDESSPAVASLVARKPSGG